MLLSAIEKGGAPDRPKGVANVSPPTTHNKAVALLTLIQIFFSTKKLKQTFSALKKKKKTYPRVLYIIKFFPFFFH